MQQQVLKRFAMCGLLSVPQLSIAEHGAPIIPNEVKGLAAPSLQLLEYLGSLVDSEDGLIGPEVFIEEEATQQHEKSKESKQETLVPEVSDDD